MCESSRCSLDGESLLGAGVCGAEGACGRRAHWPVEGMGPLKGPLELQSGEGPQDKHLPSEKGTAPGGTHVSVPES